MKVDKQANFVTTQTQVAQQLCFVYWCNRFDSLYFYDCYLVND